MFCTNCGKQFEGNFCPNCGTPAQTGPKLQKASSIKPAYPEPLTGVYTVSVPSCAVYIRKDSLSISKNNKEKGKEYRTSVEIVFSDISSIYYVNKGKYKGALLFIRTKENCSLLPKPNESQNLCDPFCAIFSEKDKAAANRLNECLSKVVEINAYSYVLPRDSKGFSFKEYSESTGIIEKLISVPKVEKPFVYNSSQENQKNGIACCPKCGSTSLSANKRGFSVGKALVGGMLTMGVGVVAGAVGSNKVIVTCLNCGHQWKP